MASNAVESVSPGISARDFSYQIRKLILEQSKSANVGHIGSALCIAEIIAVLFSDVLNGVDSSSCDRSERDRFVLSKGHAALALYAALFLRGVISQEVLASYCQEGGTLSVHPESFVPGIDFSSGSLGQGLSVACGAALAAKVQKSKRRVYCLISDAEINEGSVWEAAMFAAHHKLANLVCFIDLNGQQALGHTRDVLDIPDLGKRWRTFGWNVIELDGHDVGELTEACNIAQNQNEAPTFIIARTTFGKGVGYMEGQIKWHYLPMNDIQYQEALNDINKLG